MAFTTTNPMGDMQNGTLGMDFDEFLCQLKGVDSEHGSLSVTHDSEWALTIHQSGNVSFEHLEEGPPMHMLSPGDITIVAMLTELAQGNIRSLRARPWSKGYPLTP